MIQGMMQGRSIGHLGGVEIKLNLSVIAICLLVTYVLTIGVFPRALPGGSALFYLVGGAFTSLVFVASILWHEMAHVLMALRYRIPVIQVVLHLYGGVAVLGRDPERPEQEFSIALAGPISSMLLAGFFGLLSNLGGLAGVACAWLAQVNLMLSLFNLLPGFPLDGGRVLRAFLWGRGGSYKLATKQASRAGQFMAGLFVVLAGIMLLNNSGLFNAIWLLLIAAFLYQASTTSLKFNATSTINRDDSVRRVMRYNVEIVAPSMPLPIMAWKYLDHYKDQAFPILQNGELVGIISAVEADKIPRLEWGSVKVSDVMLPRERLFIADPDDTLASALANFDRTNTNHAPVFEHDHFVGMLNRRDIVYKT